MGHQTAGVAQLTPWVMDAVLEIGTQPGTPNVCALDATRDATASVSTLATGIPDRSSGQMS